MQDLKVLRTINLQGDYVVMVEKQPGKTIIKIAKEKHNQ